MKEPEQSEVQEINSELESTSTDLDIEGGSESGVTLDREPEEDSVASSEKKRFQLRFGRRAIFASVLGLALVGGAIFTWYGLYSGTSDSSEKSQTETVPVKNLMGAEFSIVDGLVQISPDNKAWVDAAAGDQVAEGSYIRSLADGRAVIALDDGSAIRINNDSIVRVADLDVTNIVVDNESGEVYTRLVESERQFSVIVDDETFVSLGTAYKTINTAEKQGVEVYESKVKLTKNDLEVSEGKYFYTKSSDAGQEKKLSDIPVDQVKQDVFLAWNYEQDKNDAEFKDKLGYLTKIDEQAPAEPEPVQQATPAGIYLKGVQYDKGVKLTWSVTGLSASYGFKVVKGLSANPTYGKDSAEFSKAGSSSLYWQIKDGKTYHFRVCVYTGEGCTNYSNDVTVTAPVYADPEPSGTLSLVHKGGSEFKWLLDGSAPNGYKLVWSVESAPTYPEDNARFYGADAYSGAIETDPGTYHVRVCMYQSGSCVNYSNELEVTIP